MYSSYSKMVLVSSRQFIQFSFVIVANSNVTPFYKKVSEFLFWINYSYVNAVNIVYILSTVINYIRNTFIWIRITFNHFQLLLVLHVVACTAWNFRLSLIVHLQCILYFCRKFVWILRFYLWLISNSFSIMAFHLILEYS